MQLTDRPSVRSNISASPPDWRQGAQLLLLDRFALHWRGQRIQLPHGLERLVALLALTGQPMARIDVGKNLWPELRVDKASASLRTAVWRIQRLCPVLVVCGRARLRLTTDLTIDVDQLVSQATRLLNADHLDPVDLGPLAGAMNLLPGWYDDWVMQHRERLLIVRSETLANVAAHLLRRGDIPRALDLALNATSLWPFSERNHRLIAAIHIAQGNVDEAVRQYDLCRFLFRSQLGSEPSAAFRSQVTAEAHRGAGAWLCNRPT